MRGVAILCALLAWLPVTAAAAGLPPWAADAAATAETPPVGAHAHVLLSEQNLRLPARGRVLTRERGAVRVVDPQGVTAAVVQVPYNRSSARVIQLRAWLQSPHGRVREFKRSDASDVSLVETLELENELRALVLRPDGAESGSVFAWEWELEEDELLSDILLVFAGEWPCATRRYLLTLPPGCEPRVIHSQGNVPAPVREGSMWKWESRQVAALPDEGLSAAWPMWLDYAVVAPEPRGATPGRSFSNWREVGGWLHGVTEPSLVVGPEVARTAQELAAGKLDPLERAAALARYSQAVNYLAISVGLAHGDGYRPRPAGTVLATGYGDCKDKAGLFCALARSIGLRAWLATASLEGRDQVRESWTSPAQFNHCIAALAVPSGSGLAAAVEDSPVGPIVFFDATDPDTPFGSVSSTLAGSQVLLLDGERSGLVRVPPRPVGADACSSLLVGALDDRGTLRAAWRSVFRGAEAWSRRARHVASESEWRRNLEGELSAWLGPCKVSDLKSVDGPDVATFTEMATLEVSRFAKPLGGSLVGFSTRARFGPLRWDTADTTRLTPIALRSLDVHDSLSIRLPEGWWVDALPRPAHQTTDFSSLAAAWGESGGTVNTSVRATVRPTTLPASRFSEWRSLLGAWSYVNRTQVVAKRP